MRLLMRRGFAVFALIVSKLLVVVERFFLTVRQIPGTLPTSKNQTYDITEVPKATFTEHPAFIVETPVSFCSEYARYATLLTLHASRLAQGSRAARSLRQGGGRRVRGNSLPAHAASAPGTRRARRRTRRVSLQASPYGLTASVTLLPDE